MTKISLDQIGIKYNCDKSSLNRSRDQNITRGNGHDYLRKYEFFLNRFRSKKDVKFMELGIGPDWNMGASLKMWLDYFNQPDFQITMVDINKKAEVFEDYDSRTKVIVGDLGNKSFLKNLADQRYDVIVDDASHFWAHQINCFLNLFDALNDGGVYIIEDIHTSFGNLRDRFQKNSNMDCFQFLTSLAALTAGSNRLHPDFAEAPDQRLVKIARKIDSICLVKHSAIICKSRFYD